MELSFKMLNRIAQALLSTAGLVALLGLASPSVAAQATWPMLEVDHVFDSGSASNQGNEPQVVLSFPVNFDTASSIRLHFDDVRLAGNVLAGTGSYLRITSLFDGAVQTMDATHVEQWNNSSAYFNGPAVQVDVIAFPGTGPNRVSVEALEIGIPADPQETQCGPVDDRVPSNDPRVSRLMPVGCTSWMINDCGKCMLSAGHCGANPGSMVQYNVPFSNPNGSLVFPPPSDQYAIDQASMQFLNSTDDWRYFGTFVNSTSGLTAWETQQAAFDLAQPPASPTGQSIRITGHGTDSTPDQTYNQKQQTHVGPLVSIGTNLNYQADTTGGSSGSPVIWEDTGFAIGIHTNGGCSTTGSGSNNGTPTSSVSLQAALANPMGVCRGGTNVTDLGQSLLASPFTRVPNLRMCGDLTAGSSLAIDLSVGIPASAQGVTMTAYFILGFSEANVPFEGGILVPSPDTIMSLDIDTSGLTAGASLNTTWPSSIPAGTQAWLQVWLPFSDGGTVSGTLASNALTFIAQ